MSLQKREKINYLSMTSLITFFVFTISGCKPVEEPKKNTVKVVTTQEVNPNFGFESQKFPATILRDQEITLSFRVPGVVAKLPIYIGDRVSKNQLLATIEPQSYQSNLNKIESEIEISKRTLERNEKLLEAGGIAAKDKQDKENNHAFLMAAYDSAKYDLNSTIKTSQIDGIVISKYVEVGETVQPGQPILKFADKNSPLIAKVSIPSRFKSNIKIGELVELTIAGIDKKNTARIIRIGSFSSMSTGNLIIDINLPSGIDIPSGTIAVATFNWQKKDRTMMVSIPPESILSIKNEKIDLFLMDTETSKAKRKVVDFVKFDDENVIVTGLNPGDKVITLGSSFLKDGEKVREVLL